MAAPKRCTEGEPCTDIDNFTDFLGDTLPSASGSVCPPRAYYAQIGKNSILSKNRSPAHRGRGNL